MPAPTYIGDVAATDASISTDADETGVLLGDIDFDLENPEVAFLDRFGGRVGFAINHDAAINMTVTGEVTDLDAGLNVKTFTAAVALANEEYFASSLSSHHGLNFVAASTRLVSASGSQPRGAARTITLNTQRPLGFTF